MGCPPVGRKVTCNYCKPPRAADPLVATMDVSPAVLLRFPSSTYPEVLQETSGSPGTTGGSRVAEGIPNSGATWDIVGKEGNSRR